jgi:putative hydrolase of the HAD superfamily
LSAVALPDPSRVRTVFLDAGGVLVRPNFERVRAALAEQGVAVPAETLAAAEVRARREMDVPPSRVPTDAERNFAYFNLVLARAGVARSGKTDDALRALREWHDRHNLWEWVPPGVEEALDRMEATGRRLVVVSNSNGTVRHLLDRLGLLPHFVLVVDSREEGAEKPDPRIFEAALLRSGARADEAVHVGDMYEMDVVGARASGIQPVLLDEGGLYPDVDCPRVRSLGELAELLSEPPR